MATRFYLNTTGWAPLRPTPNAGWESTLAIEDWTTRRIMYPWRMGSPSIHPFGIDNQAAVHDVLLAQYISEPLAAQTISGTIRAVVQALESNAAANIRSQMHAWVVKPDGTSRGTLTTFTTGALASEWNASTTVYRSAFFPVGSTGTTVTNVTAVAGDRIVIELGFRIHDTSATLYNARIRTGDGRFSSPGTNWDLPSDQTNTTNTRNGWIEFSANLTFQTADTTISDSIAGAPDVMPAAEGHVIARVADISTFTTEADDPTSMGDVSYSGDHAFTGWVKLVGPTGGARVKIEVGGGLGVEPFAYVFADPPVAGSAYEAYKEAQDFNTGPIVVDVPDGVTKYIAVMPGDGSFETFDIGDKNLQLIVSRARPGEISDTIADAPDALPPVQDTSLSLFSPDIDFWSTETDDPDYIDGFDGGKGYTGWVKLVVPSGGIKVNIDSYLPIDYSTGPHSTTLMVFDEVPTAASVPIAEADFSPDGSPPAGSIDQNWSGKAKITDVNLSSGTTYYVLIKPYDGPFWEGFTEGTNLQITVYRHLDGGAEVVGDFSLDALLLRITQPPYWVETAPTVVGVTTATGDESITALAIPTVEPNDLLVAFVSLDRESVSGQSVSASYDQTNPSGTPTSWTVLHNALASTNHMLVSLYKFADKLDETASFRAVVGGSTPFVSARAVGIVAIRNAGVPTLFGSIGIDTVAAGSKSSNSGALVIDTNDENYGRTVMMLGAWAGAAATPTTWTPGPVMTEELDVGRALANLTVGSWTTIYDTFFGGKQVTPSQAEIHLHQSIVIPPRTTQFGLSAMILAGGAFGLDAAIVAAYQQTRHPRTGPHYDMSPDTAIVLSNPLGTLDAGDTLQQALRELDDLISQRERGE